MAPPWRLLKGSSLWGGGRLCQSFPLDQRQDRLWIVPPPPTSLWVLLGLAVGGKSTLPLWLGSGLTRKQQGQAHEGGAHTGSPCNMQCGFLYARSMHAPLRACQPNRLFLGLPSCS